MVVDPMRQTIRLTRDRLPDLTSWTFLTTTLVATNALGSANLTITAVAPPAQQLLLKYPVRDDEEETQYYSDVTVSTPDTWFVGAGTYLPQFFSKLLPGDPDDVPKIEMLGRSNDVRKSAAFGVQTCSLAALLNDSAECTVRWHPSPACRCSSWRWAASARRARVPRVGQTIPRLRMLSMTTKDGDTR